MPAPLRFVVHSLEHARAVLAAAAQAGRAVGLDSPPACAGFHGIGWWRALLSQAAAEHPGVAFDAVLDCGDAPGHALAALRAGVTRLRVDVPAEVVDKLRAMGADLVPPSPALDLASARDPLATARALLG
ncbi:MAG: hypothetical protein ACM31L_11185 [Actinomycetota bacterium]